MQKRSEILRSGLEKFPKFDREVAKTLIQMVEQDETEIEMLNLKMDNVSAGIAEMLMRDSIGATYGEILASELSSDPVIMKTLDDAKFAFGYRVTRLKDGRRSVIKPMDSIGGFVGRMSRLCEAVSSRWTRRHDGYTMSTDTADTLVEAYKAGWSAKIRVVSGSPRVFIGPDGEETNLQGLKAKFKQTTNQTKP